MRLPKKLVSSRRLNTETADETSPIDVLGSYTGVPYDADDLVPEQDADDL